MTAEAGTLLSATLIHEVMHVLGSDPHAFAHFRDERKRRRTEVYDIRESKYLVISFLFDMDEGTEFNLAFRSLSNRWMKSLVG